MIRSCLENKRTPHWDCDVQHHFNQISRKARLSADKNLSIVLQLMRRF
ncbi:hypothetical protein ACEQPO_03940 [Bacillus sp. SL00103]